MEIVIFAVCVIALLSCLSANLLIAYMIWQHGHDKKTEPVALEETPEEKEARRAAAEAQRLYEQGFINLMEFSGRAKERG